MWGVCSIKKQDTTLRPMFIGKEHRFFWFRVSISYGALGGLEKLIDPYSICSFSSVFISARRNFFFFSLSLSLSLSLSRRTANDTTSASATCNITGWDIKSGLRCAFLLAIAFQGVRHLYTPHWYIMFCWVWFLPSQSRSNSTHSILKFSFVLFLLGNEASNGLGFLLVFVSSSWVFPRIKCFAGRGFGMAAWDLDGTGWNWTDWSICGSKHDSAGLVLRVDSVSFCLVL
ncbi:hypothetical protein EYC80_004097 [Monilinia laxa]|uniref:Uncharacterized protein n=1 Tax=Monilinia laxa TaxID=61186 RepID=A0A5N6KLR8_MONLA|nr:hypothetical protein EYC80_004097 [Monilinia laxa]